MHNMSVLIPSMRRKRSAHRLDLVSSAETCSQSTGSGMVGRCVRIVHLLDLYDALLLPQLLLHVLEQHGVGSYCDRTGAHGQGPDFWCQEDTEGIEHTCCNRNSNQIVDGRPEQVLLHLGDRRFG